MPTIRIESENSSLRGWKYFWAKTVEGFDSSQHCARCLEGKYLKQVGLQMKVNADIPMEYPENAIVYFCGVASPYVWAKNLHFPVMVKEGATCSKRACTGDTLIIEGAEELPFSDLSAVSMFPERDRSFLTCRNFQFACEYFGEA
jgi:hypothetical protein